MDNAVSLVRAYLQLNGYFTITEYPVVRRVSGRRYRSLTDVDVIGFHFPYGEPDFETDRSLRVPLDVPDMIIGEVKEGRAVINETANDPEVLIKVLRRFGCCTEDEAVVTAHRLARRGWADVSIGHRIRLVAFGTTLGPRGAYQQVLIGDVVKYLDRYVQENWDVVRTSGSKDEVFALMLLLAKARGHIRERRRGGRKPASRRQTRGRGRPPHPRFRA